MPVAGLPGGDFAGCVEKMRGQVNNPQAFCAWKTHELTGKWPAEEALNATPDTATAAPHFVEAQISPSGDKKGYVWDVVIIGPDTPDDLLTIKGREWVRSKNGRLYDVDALRNVEIWEGVKVYDNHLTDDEFKQRVGMRSFLTEGVGVITSPRFDEQSHSVCGVLKIVDDDAARKLKRAYDQGVIESVGLSIDTLTEEGETLIYEGQRYPSMTGFSRIFSVDIVSEPAAGGRFNRIIAAQTINKEQQTMDIDEIRAMVKEVVAEALAAQTPAQEQVDEETPPEDVAAEVAEVAAQAAADVPADATPEEAAAMVAEEVVDKAMEIEKEVQSMQEQIKLLKAERELDRKLEAAKLPEVDANVIRVAFKGRVFESSKLDDAIKAAKTAQASRDTTGRAVEGGAGRIYARQTFGGADAAMIDFMKRVWGGTQLWRDLPQNLENEHVRASMPEAYTSWINAGRPNTGRAPRLDNWLAQLVEGGDPMRPVVRSKESINVSYIVQDAVNVMLALAYSKKNEWWEPLVTVEEVQTIDDANLVRTYGIADLPIVNAGAAYTEMQWTDDEETGTYKKRGGYIGVNREQFLLDKVGAIKNLPKNLADAWYNTQGSLVAAVFTINSDTGPTLSDTGVLFNATAATSAGGHANLLTAALSYTAFDAAYTAMLNQTDRKLGVGNKLTDNIVRWLLVPTALRATGLQIRNTKFQPGSANNDINPYHQQFDVVMVPQWTDTNNWAVAGDKNVRPHIHMIYPMGARTPSIYTADSETSGAVFTNDQIRYKARLEVYQKSASDVCAPVADFRSLHKNNVA